MTDLMHPLVLEELVAARARDRQATAAARRLVRAGSAGRNGTAVIDLRDAPHVTAGLRRRPAAVRRLGGLLIAAGTRLSGAPVGRPACP